MGFPGEFVLQGQRTAHGRAVTRNVFANGVRLIQNTTTPGSGDEPGYAFAIASDATISQQ